MDEVELQTWHGAAIETWRTRWAVPALRVFRRTRSTNDIARAMAERGSPPGTLLLAEEQTAGRGQRGRAWSSPPGHSLSLSMILPPARARDWNPALTLRLGLAAARALEGILPVRVGLKWPNDLLIDGRKVAGILCEGVLEGDRVVHIVAGIGINLAQRDDDWTDDLAGVATSLAARTGAPVHAPDIAGAIAAAWLDVARSPEARLSDAERDDFARRDVLRGRPVRLDGRPAGVAAGISHHGALLLVDGGTEREVVAGTVRPDHPADPAPRPGPHAPEEHSP